MARPPEQLIREEAAAFGFDAVGFARVDSAEAWPAAARLAEFVEEGRHGSMSWMETTAARRAHPRALWPDARSAVVLGLNYGPDHDPREALARRGEGAISVYAQGDDYHQLIKGRLKQLAGRMASRLRCEVKVFVDTAPVMEKPLAQAAGLGWQGKHTNLVSRTHGSWLFLGVVLTTLELAAEAPGADGAGCGSCTACLDACPTDAFSGPYRIDARRCLSYLTIEHAGAWPEAFRAATGARIYGCDDCLAACPWNKFAQTARESALHARDALRAPKLADLLLLDDAAFRRLFSRSPVKRIGLPRFLRNCLYAAGNSGDPALAPAAARLLAHEDAVVRDAAGWALARLAGGAGDGESRPVAGLRRAEAGAGAGGI